MNGKSWVLIGFMLALAVVYAGCFTNWFKPGVIRIHHLTRPSGYAMETRREPANSPLTFGLEGPCRLTEIKVVRLAEWQTNRNVLPAWHLVSDSNSVPVTSFQYGHNIRGMRPVAAGTPAEPLEVNVAYRLFVTAGKARGQHDFEIGGSLPGTK